MAIKFLSGQTISGTLTVSGNVQGATFNGLAINTTGTNNVANQIVRTQANGYVNFGWINSVSGNHTGSITRITASNDAYLRYVTPAQFRTGVTDGFYAPSSTVTGVTSVATGSGLTGGTITTTGTLSVDSTVIRTTGNQSITGNTTFYPSSTSTGYSTAAIELMASSSGTGGTPPRIAWHWGGVVASLITIESNGTIAVRNNPGNDYEKFKASTITATSSMLSPIYYDADNGGYYGDFASTSVFNKINTGIGNLGRSSMASYSMTAGNWYRIANGAGRSCGDIYIQDAISGGPHGNLSFYAGSSYSQYAGTMLKLKSSSFYSVIGFTEIRLLIGTTYQDQYVEIYCQRTGTYNITVQDTHSATNQWFLSTSATVGSVPTGYSDSTRLDINGMLIAEAGNGSNRFAVDRVGAIHLSGGTSGSSGQVLTSGGTGSPTWTTLQNQTGGPFLPLAGGIMSGEIGRSAFNSGYQVGGYNNLGASHAKTNPIHVIGTSYEPTATALSNMYGIGFTRGDASFVAATNGWGMYVAGDGVSRIFLDGQNGGIGTANNSWRAPIFYDTNTAYYGDFAGTSVMSRINVGNGNSPAIQCVGNASYGAGTELEIGGWSTGTTVSKIRNSNGNLHIDSKNGHNLYLNHYPPGNILVGNGGGYLLAYQSMRSPIFYDTNTTYYGDFGSTTMGKYFGRQAHNEGFQVGGYNNVGENSVRSNPIYTIGSNYIPASTTLSSMYGIGYTHKNASFISMVGASGWGMYVAADGNARVWLDGSSGRVSATGAMYSPVYYDTNTAYYGDFASTSRLNTLNCDGAITSGTSSTGNIYCGNAGSTHFRFHTVSNTTYFDMNSGTINWRQGSSTRFYFYPSTANMTINGTLTQNSDIRIKENVIEINDCISKVQGMRGVYYNRTDFNTEVTKVGVIAQEVEAVLPELILENEESGLKSVAYSELTAVLINAIKEQQVIIDNLKSRIETLENN